jgi:hypothetical protein
MAKCKSYKLKAEHKQYVFRKAAMFERSKTLITKGLQDKEIAEEYGFDPVKVTPQAIDRLLRKPESREQVKQLRIQMLSGAFVQDNPIAHRAWRLQELLKLYKRTNSMQKRLAILREAHVQCGEDVEKIATAIAASGKQTHNHITIIERMPEEQRDDFRRTIARQWRF